MMRNSILLLSSLLLFVVFASCSDKNRLVAIEAGNIKVCEIPGNDGAEEVRAILECRRQAVDSLMSPVIGEAAVSLERFLPESPLMNFAADALLTMAQEVTGEHVDIAITNRGGLRSTIPAGKITLGDMYKVFPFENTLVLLTLNGEQLMQLCREVASVGGEAVAGIRLVITPQGELVSASVAGMPVDMARDYRIATSDYLSQGNDRMTALALGTERDVRSDIIVRDLLVQYVMNIAAKGKALTAVCDGRITVEERMLL